MLATKNGIKEVLESMNPRKQYYKGVKEYALELIENLDPSRHYTDLASLDRALLKGCSLKQYNEAPYSLYVNWEIAERLFTQTELRMTENGTNDRCDMMKCQLNALGRAQYLVHYIAMYGEV